MKRSAGKPQGAAAGEGTDGARRRHGEKGRAGKARSEPANSGAPQPKRDEDQAERQGFERQRLDPQDHPPAEVLDRGNLAGEKDFELGPGDKG
jgi:hypothetical protein